MESWSDVEWIAGGEPGVGVVRVQPQLIAPRRQSARYRERARAGGRRGAGALGATDADPGEIRRIPASRHVESDPVPGRGGGDAAPGRRYRASRREARWAHALPAGRSSDLVEWIAGGEPGVGVVRVQPQLIAPRRQSARYRERARAGGRRGAGALGA